MKWKRYSIVVFCLLAIASATAVFAQSGRKQTRTAPAAPVPTPTPEPSPTPKATDKQTELSFVLGADRQTSNFTNFPLTYYDAALQGCAQRLRSATSAQISVSSNDMSRSDAIKKAKAETTAYTVLFKLALDSSATSYDDLELQYVVLAPGTAKIVTTGSAYQNRGRVGPVVVGPTTGGTTTGMYREQLLRREGEDAAERIMKVLHLNVPVMN